MKQVAKQIMAIVLAFVVVCTTMSFTINMHYCGETLVDYTVINKASSCGMYQMTSSLSNTDCEQQVTQKSCCQDKTFSAAGQNELKPSFSSFSLEQQLFVTTFYYAYAALLAPQTTASTDFFAYTPPQLVRDIQTLDEVYLI